ncbi:Syntaxin 1A [Nesidiocoris tenuis]|uniref:Syntaxin 1A n=1 Tax=Nesidiocoris tenuis TaxID=355587 RepID=A0ABN7AXH4_9HEMI|nr:Syntaxin 1A [Nesidiocoris tenuis]
MTKDRTMQLRQGASMKKKGSLRAAGERKNEEEMVVLTIQNSNSSTVKTTKSTETNELGAVFQKVREVTELIESMKENIVLLKKVHVLLQQSPRIDPKTKEKSDDLSSAIKSACMEARKKIKELKPPTPSGQKKDSKAQQQHQTAVNRVKTTQHGLLVKMLQDTVEDYEKCLDAHKQISESMIKKQLHIVVQMVLRKMPCVPANVEVSDDELMVMLDSQDLAVFVQDYMRETNEAMQSLQDAKALHKEIIAIEKSIEQIRDMMLEITLNIHQQGEMVDKIEYHIGKGVAITENAQQKISKAHKMMIKARKKKLCLAICLTSVLAILLLYLTLYITMNQR